MIFLRHKAYLLHLLTQSCQLNSLSTKFQRLKFTNFLSLKFISILINFYLSTLTNLSDSEFRNLLNGVENLLITNVQHLKHFYIPYFPSFDCRVRNTNYSSWKTIVLKSYLALVTRVWLKQINNLRCELI